MYKLLHFNPQFGPCGLNAVALFLNRLTGFMPMTQMCFLSNACLCKKSIVPIVLTVAAEIQVRVIHQNLRYKEKKGPVCHCRQQTLQTSHVWLPASPWITTSLCQVTSGMSGALCRWQVMYTINGQSLGCMRTPAAWAQVGWNAVEQRPWEHCTQQPFTSLFIRFLQNTHFCPGGRDTTTEVSGGSASRKERKWGERKHCWWMARERMGSGCRRGQTKSEARHEQELGAVRGNDKTSLILRHQQDQFRSAAAVKDSFGKRNIWAQGRKSVHDLYKMFLSQCFSAKNLFVVAYPYFQFCMMTCS